MRSSPAYADLVLELPSVTVADCVGAALVVAAGAYGVAVFAGQGFPMLALAVGCASLVVAARQVLIWTRSRRRSVWRLELCPDGSLQVCVHGGPVAATLGPRTRRLGPSVVLDLQFTLGGERSHYQSWLTPLDVPAHVLRRWTVVLPFSGRAACS